MFVFSCCCCCFLLFLVVVVGGGGGSGCGGGVGVGVLVVVVGTSHVFCLSVRPSDRSRRHWLHPSTGLRAFDGIGSGHPAVLWCFHWIS